MIMNIWDPLLVKIQTHSVKEKALKMGGGVGWEHWQFKIYTKASSMPIQIWLGFYMR